MTYAEWIEQVEKIREQYQEGAIMANEYFNAVIARACEVDQKLVCSVCGKEGTDLCEDCA